MSEEDLKTITSLLRATKAVVGIGDGAEIHVSTTVPLEGHAESLEIEAWKCGQCDEIHSIINVIAKNTLVVLDPDDLNSGGSPE